MLRWISLTRISGVFVLAATLALPVAGLGQATATDMKIGVFNPDRVIAESAQGQEAIAQLDQLQSTRVGELQTQQQAITRLQQRSMQAAPDSQAILQRQLQDRQIQFQRLQEDVQEELQRRQQELTQPIIERIAEIIERIGAEENFTMIFNVLQGGLVYVDESVDLTDRIIEELDTAEAAGTPGGG